MVYSAWRCFAQRASLTNRELRLVLLAATLVGQAAATVLSVRLVARLVVVIHASAGRPP
jgi:hypothetical protein